MERLGPINKLTESVRSVIDFGRPMAQKIQELSKTPKVRGIALGLGFSAPVAIVATLSSAEELLDRAIYFSGTTGVMGIIYMNIYAVKCLEKFNQEMNSPHQE